MQMLPPPIPQKPDSSAPIPNKQKPSPRPCPLARPGLKNCGGTCEAIHHPLKDEWQLEVICKKCQELHPFRISADLEEQLGIGIQNLMVEHVIQKTWLLGPGEYLCVTQAYHLRYNVEIYNAPLPIEDCPKTGKNNKFCEKCLPVAKVHGHCKDDGLMIFHCVLSSNLYERFPFRDHWKAAENCRKVTNGAYDSTCTVYFNKISEDFAKSARLDIDAATRERYRLSQCFVGAGQLKKLEDTGAIVPREGERVEERAPDPTPKAYFPPPYM
ncbi:hypothetical protein CC80DRAFT_553692 [Byssothecium circinans]|uniref:Uncharacterized protein n=1 Tax=Byssothecium circinans TaxID=147558 RepID=A0A6A5TGZ1_9PLEO|nr:hypothetical protein CC80DRAFT_553692 [Byssothecium circinans]